MSTAATPPCCLALVTDLIFATRISATAAGLGAACRIVRSAQALEEALATGEPGTALVDLNAEGLDAVAAVARIRAARPGCRVVAFLSHVQRELAERARAAGAHEVVPRSVFVQRLPQWLA